MIQVISGNGIPSSHLPFSPAIKAGGFVFVSGQASVDATGKIVVDTFEGEMRRSMENIRVILAAAGLDFSHVVQVKSYVGTPEYMPEYNQIYRDYFKEPYPARSTIVNCLGTALKFEIDVIAFAG
ncbi:RidA family protein [Zavarzinella formosa]|uniref:RidA family protein n=1 Tax=Zavarzinella formosa TaxID=360055 RepID=UPI000319BCC9|nr:RidA family protein [Zavarzinella formosa]